MIDTHTHLYLNEFSDGGDETVVRAIASGVGHLILPNVDNEGSSFKVSRKHVYGPRPSSHRSG